MNKRLIIDSQLAAQDPAALFYQDWSWPVAQSAYDRLVTDVIEWSDELHHEISDSDRLLAAFLLIKADLLKDLSYYLVGWIDVVAALENGSELIFRPDQYIYADLVSNRFTNRIPTQHYHSSKAVGLKTAIRSRLSRIKRYWNNRAALSTAGPVKFLIGPNPLAVQITGSSAQRLALNNGDVARRRPSSTNMPERLSQLADHITDAVSGAISRATREPSDELRAHINYLALTQLRKGWTDAGLKTIFSPSHPDSTLVTGTGSGYAARLLSYQFTSNGSRVIRTSHGGDPPLFDDPLWPSIELPFADKYVVNGRKAAITANQALSKRSESAIPHYTKSIIGGGSQYHLRIRKSAVHTAANKVKTVSVVTASFTSMHRVTPHMKLHDVVYMEWHRRLLQDIGRLGHTVLSKRHPKGMMTGTHIFSDVADEELLQTPMSAIEDRTDAYVIDFPASALMESVCTLKPVVLIDLPIRRMRPEARALLSQSVAIVRAGYDERNRVVVDQNELSEGLAKPVDLDAREQLLNEYLLQPASNASTLFE